MCPEIDQEGTHRLFIRGCPENGWREGQETEEISWVRILTLYLYTSTFFKFLKYNFKTFKRK